MNRPATFALSPLPAFWLGRADYEATCALQERLREQVLAGGPEVLLLCEHAPVLTLGRFATPADVLADAATLAARGVAVQRTRRGGKVTYHGPGQLVLYPIVRLRQGIVRHAEMLAAAAVKVAASLGVEASFERERVGVFVGPRKLAAIGVHVQKRVSIHGMALNVTTEAAAAFRHGWFLPCGEAGAQIACLAEEAIAGSSPLTLPLTLPLPLTVEALARPLAEAFCAEIGVPLGSFNPATAALISENLFVK
jgi:lipoyl(octanoyl) transferase